MSVLNNRTTDNLHEVRVKKATSSYGLLKMKYVVCSVQSENFRTERGCATVADGFGEYARVYE
jgi:hypothetical protein